MACRPLPGGSGFACSRGSAAPRCVVAGCSAKAVALCDYALRGTLAGHTCDRMICAAHRRPQAPDVDYCPTHHEQARASA